MNPSYSNDFNLVGSFWEDFNAFSDGENTSQSFFDHEESHNGFSLPNQGTCMMNQTSLNQLTQAAFTQASTSSGVMNNNGKKKPGTAQNRPVQTKKQIDKAYRERVKDKQKQMEADISELSTENAHLKNENESLIKVTSTTNKSSQSATAEKEKLEKDISLLNHDIKNLQNFFDLYSKRLVNSNHVDHQAELIHLKSKISILSQNSNRNSWMTEKKQLEDEIAKLEHQNKVLKVQVEVLSEMKTDKELEDKQA